MLADRQDECQKTMTEMILLEAEIKQETANISMSQITAKVVAISNEARSQGDVTLRVNNAFGLGGGSGGAGSQEEVGLQREAVRAAVSLAAPSPPPPVVQIAEESEEAGASGGFGLLATGSAVKKTHVNGFFDDDAPIVPVLTDGGEVVVSSLVGQSAPAKKAEVVMPAKIGMVGKLRCMPLQPGIKLLARREEVLSAVYEDGLLEHPAVPGLVLGLAERLYGALLEIAGDDGGEIRLETGPEKRWRIKWQKPVAPTVSSTAGDFVKMHTDI